MRITMTLLTLTLMSNSTLATPEPEGCTDPFQQLAPSAAETLRALARRCSDASVRTLYFNRAYHRDTLQHLATLRRLQTFPKKSDPGSDEARFQQSRVFITLAELFAEQSWKNGSRTSLHQLNQAYDQSIAIMESRIRGETAIAVGDDNDNERSKDFRGASPHADNAR